jgi:hypothetical protein
VAKPRKPKPTHQRPTQAALYHLARQRQALAFHWHGDPGKGGASPPQMAFHKDTSRKRMVLWPNKVGKGRALAAEIWGLITDSHPWDSIEHPARLIILLPDVDKMYADDMCVSLREMEPPKVLDPACHYSAPRGYTVSGGRGIFAANGDQVLFRSSHQDIRSIAGVWGPRVYLNEPPSKHAMGEIVRAIANTDHGRISMLFTAAEDPRHPQSLMWIKHLVCGDEEPSLPSGVPFWESVPTAGGWSLHNFELRADNCKLTVPHRTRQSVRNQIADCNPWEYDQRILARWTAATSDRKLGGFTESCKVDDDVIPADARLGLSFDHGERPGAEVGLLIATWRTPEGNARAHVIDEYVSHGRSSVADDAQGVVDMLASHGYTLGSISRGRGDTNTSGKESEYRRVNHALVAAFAQLGGGSVPFGIASPDKRPGSVDYGHWIINSAFLKGALTINARCAVLSRGLEHWRGGKSGADGDLSHPIDALRYYVYDVLDEYIPSDSRWRAANAEAASIPTAAREMGGGAEDGWADMEF